MEVADEEDISMEEYEIMKKMILQRTISNQSNSLNIFPNGLDSYIVMFDASRPFLKRRIVSELGKATAVNFCHYFSIYHYCEFWVSILVQI